MGGCEVNLQGGEYKISQPILIPEYNANMNFGHGSIVAAKNFVPIGSPDGDPYLIIVGKPDSCKVPQGSCNIDINFPDPPVYRLRLHIESAIRLKTFVFHPSFDIFNSG